MLVVYSEDAELARRLADRIRRPEATEIVGEWVQLRRLVSDATCVVAARPVPEPDFFARLQALKDREPGVPLVVIVGRDPDTLRRLKDVVVEEVVWVEEVEDDLLPALRRADSERRFHAVEERLRSATHLSPTLVAALVRAVRRRPPLTSVGTLAAEVERDRRTIWHHWQEGFRGDAELTPKGFLDWILLLRACSIKTDDNSWRTVADDLGVHTRTIRRVAERRIDASLDRVASESLDAVFDGFRREVLEPLTVPPPPRAASR